MQSTVSNDSGKITYMYVRIYIYTHTICVCERTIKQIWHMVKTGDLSNKVLSEFFVLLQSFSNVESISPSTV